MDSYPDHNSDLATVDEGRGGNEPQVSPNKDNDEPVIIDINTGLQPFCTRGMIIVFEGGNKLQ